ncbi:MAG: hypothetical protein R3Y43_01120 [Alphaproteobacteria bacterium]
MVLDENIADVDVEDEKITDAKSSVKKKLIVVFVLLLLAAAVGVALYSVFSKKTNDSLSYKIFESTDGNDKAGVVIYTLPEVKAILKDSSSDDNFILRLQIALEFKDASQIKGFEVLLPKLLDVIVLTTMALKPSEVDTAKGIFWLKEELLYRANLVLAPIEIINISFVSFNLEKDLVEEIEE